MATFLSYLGAGEFFDQVIRYCFAPILTTERRNRKTLNAHSQRIKESTTQSTLTLRGKVKSRDVAPTMSKDFDKFNTIFDARHANAWCLGINTSLQQMKYTLYSFLHGMVTQEVGEGLKSV